MLGIHLKFSLILFIHFNKAADTDKSIFKAKCNEIPAVFKKRIYY